MNMLIGASELEHMRMLLLSIMNDFVRRAGPAPVGERVLEVDEGLAWIHSPLLVQGVAFGALMRAQSASEQQRVCAEMVGTSTSQELSTDYASQIKVYFRTHVLTPVSKEQKLPFQWFLLRPHLALVY